VSGQPAAVGEEHGITLVARQAPECAKQGSRALAPDDRLGRALLLDTLSADLLDGALDGRLARRAGAPPVEGPRASHHRHVARERAARWIERLGPQPELHEDVLDDVLGGALVAEHLVG
jgi:hypothetical protein